MGAVRVVSGRFMNRGCAVQNPHEKIRATNWQVSIMDTDRHREYTYCVLDFIYPDGRPYQNKKRVVLGESGIEEVKKDIELKILDSDEVRHPWLNFSGMCGEM